MILAKSYLKNGELALKPKMVASYVIIIDDEKWNACLLGYKPIAMFWFGTIVFLKTTSLSFIWLALLFLSETIFLMCSKNNFLT